MAGSVNDLHFLCYIKIFIMIIVLITTSHIHVTHFQLLKMVTMLIKIFTTINVLYTKIDINAALKFVATVKTGGRVKIFSAV